MRSAKHARVTSSVVALLLAVAVMGVATPAVAASGPAMWTLQQTLASSGDVHSPTFITPQRGWAVIGTRLLHTSDGGRSWSVFVPPQWITALPIGLSFADAVHGWAVGDGFITATTDGGAHWATQAVDVSHGAKWLAVKAVDATHAFAVGDSGVVLGTDDGGVTWTKRIEVAGAALYALCFPDAAHGWAVGVDTAGHGLVLTTADGGTTWSAQANPASAGLSAVWFIDASHGWAAGAGGVIRTTTGGANWNTSGSPLGPTPGPQRATLAFVSETHGFLGLSSGDDTRPCLWETTDGGTTWTDRTPITEKAGVWGLAVLDSTHVLATGVSLPSGHSLTSGRIWAWSPVPSSVTVATGSATTLASNSGGAAKAAPKKTAARKHAHKAKRARHAKR